MTNPPELNSIHGRLRWAREKAGLTQAQVAAMLKLQRPTISNLENAQRQLTAVEVDKFSKIYCVDAQWIISGETLVDKNLVEIAARELAKLKGEDLDTILTMIQSFRQADGSNEAR